jgi:hypothetical protein
MAIDVSGLDYIEDFLMPVYSSPGGDKRARGIAARAERSFEWLSHLTEMPPLPPLFVLDPGHDWDRIALSRHYGLAHVNRTRIVTGQRQSGMWTAVTEGIWSELSATDKERLTSAYGTPPDLSAFGDMIISHELTHLAHSPGRLDDTSHGRRNWSAESPRLLWVAELFANLGMQGYIAEREPESLAAMETVFEVIGQTSPARWTFHRLDEMYNSTSDPGMDGTNYVWFEFRLQMLAKRLWNSAGAAGFQRLSGILHGPALADEEIIGVLSELDPTVADDVRRWSDSGEPAF